MRLRRPRHAACADITLNRVYDGANARRRTRARTRRIVCSENFGVYDACGHVWRPSLSLQRPIGATIATYSNNRAGVSTSVACHSMPLHAATCNCVSLHLSISLHVTACHCVPLHATASHGMSLHVTACNCMSLHVTVCHCMQLHLLRATACQCTSLHFTACHCMSLLLTVWHCM